MTTKGNLLKDLQTTHSRNFHLHKEERAKALESTTQSDQSTLQSCDKGTVAVAGIRKPRKELFKKEHDILTCIVKNLCGRGGSSINTVEQD